MNNQKLNAVYEVQRLKASMSEMVGYLQARNIELENTHNAVVENASPAQLATYAKALKFGWGISSYENGIVRVYTSKGSRRYKTIDVDGNFS